MRKFLFTVIMALISSSPAYPQMTGISEIFINTRSRSVLSGTRLDGTTNRLSDNWCYRVSIIRFRGGKIYQSADQDYCSPSSGTGDGPIGYDQGFVFQPNGSVKINRTCKTSSGSSTVSCSDGTKLSKIDPSVAGSYKETGIATSVVSNSHVSLSLSRNVVDLQNKASVSKIQEIVEVSVSGNNCKVTRYQVRISQVNTGGLRDFSHSIDLKKSYPCSLKRG